MVSELETPPNGGQPDARVVVEQHASVPLAPAIPKAMRNVAIGLALGVIVGIGLAILRDLLDNTIKDRTTLEEITGVGLVGSVPLAKDLQTKPAIAFDSDNSAIAEAFRKLRTNLQFLAVDNPPRVIVVTSPMPMEGKSVTATNLALALAEAEHSVVLVDGDLRRPRLDSISTLSDRSASAQCWLTERRLMRYCKNSVPWTYLPRIGKHPAEPERTPRVIGS